MEGKLDFVGSNIASSSTTPAAFPILQSMYDKMLAQLNALRLPSDLDRKYQNKGSLEHQARLLQALDAGYPFLAQKILEIDHELSVTMAEYSGLLISDIKHSQELDKALESMFDCLVTISNVKGKGLLRAMLEGHLGRYIYEGGQLPTLLKPDQVGMNFNEQIGNEYQPVVFVSIHCNNRGEAPSKAEYLVIMERIKTYLNTSGGECQQKSDEYAQKVDFDRFACYPAIPTNANSGISNNSEQSWINEPHGRRYANTAEKIKALKNFISTFERRLKAIPDLNLESCIPWHLTHVDWSPQYGKQKKEYNKYDMDHIKILMETITSLEFPSKDYSMHIHPITSLPSCRELSVAHIISILTASYACHGGLNHTAIGMGADIDYAQRLPAECWKAGAASLAHDGFMLRNMVICKWQILIGDAITTTHVDQQEVDYLNEEIADIEDGNEKGLAIENRVGPNIATNFGRKAVSYLKPEPRASTLRITHPELLAATEGSHVQRLAIAPFIVIDEEPTEMEIDFGNSDMDEDEEEDEDECDDENEEKHEEELYEEEYMEEFEEFDKEYEEEEDEDDDEIDEST